MLAHTKNLLKWGKHQYYNSISNNYFDYGLRHKSNLICNKYLTYFQNCKDSIVLLCIISSICK